MGKIPQGILGGVSGKVGSVVGGGWKGINYLRSKPLSVANPRTVGQVEQRDKMSYMVLLSQAWLATIVKPLWDRFAQKMSGYNAFVSANIANVASSGDGFDDYSLVEIGKGKIEKVVPTMPLLTSVDDEIVLNWSTSVSGQQSASDIAYVGIIVSTAEADYFYSANGVARSVGTMTIPAQLLEVGNIVFAYLSFRSADGRNVSGTGFVTQTISA